MPTRKGKREHDIGGRERLQAAALRLFAAKGYAATTVRDILRAAGVTAPVLYYHFGNKEGLFLALAREGLGKLNAALGAAAGQTGTAADRVRAFCRAATAVRQEFEDLAGVVEAVLSGPPKGAPRLNVRSIFANMMRRLTELISAGVETGEFRPCDPEPVALALLGAVEMVARLRLRGLSTVRLADQLEGMMSVILAGLTP